MTGCTVPLDEVVYFDVVTHNPSTGAISNADSTPTFDVYEEATDTGMLGATNFTQRTALTGNYRGTFTASAANGFEVGKWYNVIASATVNAIAGKCVALTFMLRPAETVAGVPKVDPNTWDGTDITTGVPLAPTVAGRTLDVSAGGEAGLDWANIGSPTTAQNLSGTSTKAVEPTVAGRTLDVSVGGEAGIDWANVGTPGSTVNLSATTVNLVNTVTTVTTTTNLTNLPSIPANWLTAAGTAADFGTELATAVWTDTTASDFTVAASIGKSIMNGVALGTGLTINAYTGNTPQTGDSYAIVNHASYGNAQLVRSTTPANKLDISATGEAGLDWANVGSPSTAQNLSGTTINLVNTLTTYTGNTPQTGDSFARIGATGSGLTSITSKTDNLPSDPADQSLVESAILNAWTTAMTEAYAADGVAPTPAQMLFMLWSALAEFAISGTTITAKKLDGSTTAMTFTLDSSTAPTSRTRAT